MTPKGKGTQMTLSVEGESGAYTLFWEAMSGAMAVEFVLEEAGLP